MIRSKLIALLAAGFIAVFVVDIAAAGELSDKDRIELATLYQDFAVLTKLADYPKYLDELSLMKCMTAHRTYLNMYLRINGEAEIAKFYTFTPDLETVLQERDPAKYFTSITLADPAATKLAGQPGKIVGITGEDENAYIITEVPPMKGKEEDGPDYLVYPALRTPMGWRMDATTTLVHELEAIVRRTQKAYTPQDPQSGK